MQNRRGFTALASAAAFAGLFAPSSGRADLVSRPARIMVGFPAGASPDFVARVLAEYLKGYASSMIVDSRPGAGGRLPLDALKGSDPDGSVMVLTPGDQVALFPHVYAKLGYDVLRDFAPISTVCMVQFLWVVGPLVPAQVTTLADFVAWCRVNPKLASYGSPGEGTRPHFMGVSFARGRRGDDKRGIQGRPAGRTGPLGRPDRRRSQCGFQRFAAHRIRQATRIGDHRAATSDAPAAGANRRRSRLPGAGRC